MKTISATDAQSQMAALLDQVTSEREPVVITRPGRPSVALLPTAELDALLTTIHLLRSPANAERLLTALERATSRGIAPKAATPD
jgi:antitoxin YefM